MTGRLSSTIEALQEGVLTVETEKGKIKISQLNRTARAMLRDLVPPGFEGNLEKFLEDNQDSKIFYEFSQKSQDLMGRDKKFRCKASKMLSLKEVLSQKGNRLKNKIFRIAVKTPRGIILKRYV